MINLWPFQERLIAQVRQAIRQGNRKILLVSPTGSGKTVMFAYLVSRMAEKGVRSNIMVHRQELLEQVSDTLDDFDAPHGYVAAGEELSPGPLTHVSSVFTLARRLDTVPVPKYAICDEAHHCIPGSTWAKCVDAWAEDCFLLGVTATPERLSGEGLGGTFDTMVVGPGVAELIGLGFLSKYKMFAPPEQLDTSQLHMRGGDYKKDEVEGLVNKPSITGNAVAHYRKFLNGAPAVAFCVSRKHAAAVAEDFRAAGFRAASIDGTLKKPERKQMVQDFSNGQLNVMTSCMLINEGFDVPGMYGAIMLNPTESLAKYLQECGRPLRTHPGKDYAILMDHVGNSGRHGLPCENREWSLESKARTKRARDPDDIAIRQCGKCGAVAGAAATRCVECGTVFPVKPRTIREIEGELKEVERVEKKSGQGRAGPNERFGITDSAWSDARHEIPAPMGRACIGCKEKEKSMNIYGNSVLNIRVRQDISSQCWQVFGWTADLETRRRSAVLPLVLEDEQPAEDWAPMNAMAQLRDEEIQVLMDDLWVEGVRPSKRLLEEVPLDHLKGEVDWNRKVIQHLLPGKFSE